MVNTHAGPTSWVCGLLQSHRSGNWDLKLLSHGLGILNHILIILSLNVCFTSEVQRDDEASTRDSETQHTRGPTPCHHPAMRLWPPASPDPGPPALTPPTLRTHPAGQSGPSGRVVSGFCARSPRAGRGSDVMRWRRTGSAGSPGEASLPRTSWRRGRNAPGSSPVHCRLRQ